MTTTDPLVLRALAVTTRRRLLDMIEQAPSPPSVRELATAVALHENTVRLHLQVLVDAGLVEGLVHDKPARGRPSVRYTAVNPQRADEDESYRHLARWIASSLPPEAARAAGRAIGEAAATRSTLVDLLDAEGFAPAISDDAPAIVLEACPYAGAAAGAPEVVCALHQGVIDGFADAHHTDPAVLTPWDPAARGLCTIRNTSPIPSEGQQ